MTRQYRLIQFLRKVIRVIFREKCISIKGESSVPLWFRPSEYPSLLKGIKYFEPQTKSNWKYLLQEEDTIFDIGANIGITVQRFCALTNGKCYIFAFEPSQQNVQLLKKNVADLNTYGIEIIESAVGNYEGYALLNENYEHGGLSFLSNLELDKPKKKDFWHNFAEKQVRIITLDNYLEENPRVFPEFIKIDVEGAGGSVIEGAKNVLAEYKPVLTCSFHSIKEKESIINTINMIGYQGVKVDNNGICHWCELDKSEGHFVHYKDPRAKKFRG